MPSNKDMNQKNKKQIYDNNFAFFSNKKNGGEQILLNNKSGGLNQYFCGFSNKKYPNKNKEKINLNNVYQNGKQESDFVKKFLEEDFDFTTLNVKSDEFLFNGKEALNNEDNETKIDFLIENKNNDIIIDTVSNNTRLEDYSIKSLDELRENAETEIKKFNEYKYSISKLNDKNNYDNVLSDLKSNLIKSFYKNGIEVFKFIAVFSILLIGSIVVLQYDTFKEKALMLAGVFESKIDPTIESEKIVDDNFDDDDDEYYEDENDNNITEENEKKDEGTIKSFDDKALAMEKTSDVDNLFKVEIKDKEKPKFSSQTNLNNLSLPKGDLYNEDQITKRLVSFGGNMTNKVDELIKGVNIDVGFKIDAIPYENRLVIPKLQKNIPLLEVKKKQVKDVKDLEDVFMKELENGIVRYPLSAKPGEKGNSFIFGHSSNYSWSPGDYNNVFSRLNELESGDKIEIFYGQKKYVYKIKEKAVIKPGDVDILKRNNNKAELSLMTCWPIGTSQKRLIVIGELVS